MSKRLRRAARRLDRPIRRYESMTTRAPETISGSAPAEGRTPGRCGSPRSLSASSSCCLAGFAAYSLWPRGGTLAPRMASETAEQPATNVPYIYLRQPVYYRTTYPVGTIIVDKVQNFLYVVRPNTSALRYGIGTGSECVSLAGFFKILRKEEWPGWKPPPQQSAGAADDRMKNPLGARALYLDHGQSIHGTNASFTIGQRTRDGCIRLVNDDVIYFYDRDSAGKPSCRAELAEIVRGAAMDRAQTTIKWLTVVLTVLTAVLVIDALLRWFVH